jgi:hypothetical protein
MNRPNQIKHDVGKIVRTVANGRPDQGAFSGALCIAMGSDPEPITAVAKARAALVAIGSTYEPIIPPALYEYRPPTN